MFFDSEQKMDKMAPFPYKMIDLTHTLDEAVPSWDGSCGFKTKMKWERSENTPLLQFCLQRIEMDAGIGTHMDAPAHCVKGGVTIDQLDLLDLLLPCQVIDVSARSYDRFCLSVKDVEEFEKTYGEIKPHSFVMIRTGWERFWKEPKAYRNNHIFPSVSKEAAKLFLERQIAALGIDTLSPDRPEDGEIVHHLLLGSGKYIVENVAHSDLLPPVGSFILALPLKVRGGAEASIRLSGLVEKKEVDSPQ